MKFANARRLITPDKPVFMHGFGARTHKSEGVHDELYAKVVLFGTERLLLVVALDVLGGDHSFETALKGKLYHRFQFPPEDILLNFSHTHASVYLTGRDPELRRSGYSINQDDWPLRIDEIDYSEDERYYAFIEKAIVEMVEECIDNLMEGTLSVASDSANLAISRRLAVDGKMMWLPNDQEDYDKELTVLKFQALDGSLKAVIFSYGCHPTTLGADNYLLSADFCGAACRSLEERNPGVEALFLQGCGGELKPQASVHDNRFRPCTFEQMEQAGRVMAEVVASILQSGRFEAVESEWRTQLLEVKLPVEPYALDTCREIAADESDKFKSRSAARLLDMLADGTAIHELPVQIAIWQLGSRLKLIAIEGEVTTQYSLMIKKMFPAERILVLGYSNAVFCYIPTEKIVREGGYEAECNYFFGLAGPFALNIEQIILGSIKNAVEEHLAKGV